MSTYDRQDDPAWVLHADAEVLEHLDLRVLLCSGGNGHSRFVVEDWRSVRGSRKRSTSKSTRNISVSPAVSDNLIPNRGLLERSPAIHQTPLAFAEANVNQSGSEAEFGHMALADQLSVDLQWFLLVTKAAFLVAVDDVNSDISGVVVHFLSP